MEDGMIIAIVAMGTGGLIAIVSIVFGMIQNVSMHASTERSRRELSAYVAEGSISAEEAERILKAGPKKKKS